MKVSSSAERDYRQKVWNLIKDAHSALLVTIGPDGRLDSRPMGCLQREFDDTLWFLTFRHSPKAQELFADDRVLVSYSNPAKYEYVSISGRGRMVDDKARVKDLWFEGLRVWFPNGPDDPELALLSIDVEEARYWTNAASIVSYAWSYVKARVTGQPASADEVVETKRVKL
jgi:general stress protein 26